MCSCGASIDNAAALTIELKPSSTVHAADNKFELSLLLMPASIVCSNEETLSMDKQVFAAVLNSCLVILIALIAAKELREPGEADAVLIVVANPLAAVPSSPALPINRSNQWLKSL